MSQDRIEQLMESGDFLSLTRENEWTLMPFDFTLKNKTQVEVWDTGVIVFTPKKPEGTDIILSSAIHGNETAPIEICDQMIKDIISGELALSQRAMFIFGNPASINIEKRFVEENLNRLFSGEHSKPEPAKSDERVRAKKLEQYVERFFTRNPNPVSRCHYDLHTAIRGSKNEKFAVYPFLHGKPWHKSQFNFLLASGVNTVLLMQAPATTFSYFSSSLFNAHSFTIELGQVKPFGQNDMTRFEQIDNALRCLLTAQELNVPAFDESQFDLFEVYRTINRETESFELNFADDVLNFTDFPVGFVLAKDGDKEIAVEKEGEAIIFPNANVAIGQRAMLTVIPTSVDGQVV
ncbi:succinylglutamate desuccinylase [Flocculibacter collagenilyticus]|uniref:succinylglutamate desuccinylase n=1 Tax=Flocculibacter collagenilyticus TaxID=2744479 RepID=UPI0018F5A9C4|nr:succinylglutamate desuccinylase [Flocculibacter collagenilyticus]